MATVNAQAALPNSQPGPWGEPVTISDEQRDVLLYAVGIVIQDLDKVNAIGRSAFIPTSLTRDLPPLHDPQWSSACVIRCAPVRVSSHRQHAANRPH